MSLRKRCGRGGGYRLADRLGEARDRHGVQLAPPGRSDQGGKRKSEEGKSLSKTATVWQEAEHMHARPVCIRMYTCTIYALSMHHVPRSMHLSAGSAAI